MIHICNLHFFFFLNQPKSPQYHFSSHKIPLHWSFILNTRFSQKHSSIRSCHPFYYNNFSIRGIPRKLYLLVHNLHIISPPENHFWILQFLIILLLIPHQIRQYLFYTFFHFSTSTINPIIISIPYLKNNTLLT